MSFLQRLEMMQWSVGGYRNGDSDSGGGGGSDSGGMGPSWSGRTERDRAQYASDSSGNRITDSSGNPISTPTSGRNYDEQQERLADRAAQDSARTAAELAALAQQQQDAYYNEAYGGIQNLFDFDTEFENYGSDNTRTLLNALYADQQGNLTSDSATNFVTDAINIAQAGLAGTKFLEPETFTQAKTLLDRSGGNANLEFNEELGGVVARNPPSIATFANNIGKGFGGKALGSVTGGFVGDAIFSLLGSDLSAVQPALYGDAIAGGLTEFGAKSLFENTNIFEGVDGTLYINDTVTNPFTGEFYNNFKTVEQKTQETIALNEEQQKNQSQSDYDTGQVREIVSNSTGNNINWRDFRGEQFSMSPVDIINSAVADVPIPPEVVDAARFAGRVAVGEDPLTVGLSIYGDNITSVLPEGYQRPTEAAIRIGIGGENRVAVLGDIYGEDFNLDNPIGKAGLKGAEVYDMTGDGDKALQESVYTYFKEGGKLPDYEVPAFLPEVETNINLDWLKDAGFKVGEAVDFLGNIDFPSLNMSVPELKAEGVDFDKINFEGVKAGDLGITLPEAKELGIDIGSLDLGDIDLPSIEAGLDIVTGASGGQGVLPDSGDEFVSLASEFDIAQDDESLARKLIQTAV